MSKKEQKEWNPERLRRYKGFENYSDEMAWKAIDTIDRLARILLSIAKDNPSIFKEKDKAFDQDSSHGEVKKFE